MVFLRSFLIIIFFFIGSSCTFLFFFFNMTVLTIDRGYINQNMGVGENRYTSGKFRHKKGYLLPIMRCNNIPVTNYRFRVCFRILFFTIFFLKFIFFKIVKIKIKLFYNLTFTRSRIFTTTRYASC